jgi:hypothetical protein
MEMDMQADGGHLDFLHHWGDPQQQGQQPSRYPSDVGDSFWSDAPAGPGCVCFLCVLFVTHPPFLSQIG